MATSCGRSERLQFNLLTVTTHPYEEMPSPLYTGENRDTYRVLALLSLGFITLWRSDSSVKCLCLTHRLTAVTFELMDSGCALETVNVMEMLLLLYCVLKTRCLCKEEGKSFKSSKVTDVDTQATKSLVSHPGTPYRVKHKMTQNTKCCQRYF